MNLWKKIFVPCRGFSTAEVLIAVGIFSLAAVITSSLLFEVIKLQKKSDLQDSLYEDSRLILQQITNQIRGGTIDYDEYYSMNVIQQSETKYYGLYHGVYGGRFYDPGKSLNLTHNPTQNPRDLGIECSHPLGNPMDNCEVTYTLSTDLNTGQNPFKGDSARANAFCDGNRGSCTAPVGTTNELYLIDSTGTQKTIIAKKLVEESGEEKDYVVGIVKMRGTDSDQNGMIDTFVCLDEYVCSSYNSLELPSNTDLNDPFNENIHTQFVPFTPLSVDVKSLIFVINPVEDPYKAFSETAMQTHPSVTIIMTLGLSEKAKENYPGDLEDITVQSTVKAGVLGGLPTYPPTNDLNWMKSLGIPAY